VSTPVSLSLIARMRWWFKPWKLGVLAFVLVTGREPSSAWISKWVARAVRIEVKQ